MYGYFLARLIRGGNDGGDFQDETGAAAGFAVDLDLAAVFAEDFLAYGQS